MVHTGTLPAPDALESPRQTQPLVYTLRETGPLVAPEETVMYNRVKDGVNTHPLYDAHVHDDLIQQKTMLSLTERITASLKEALLLIW